MVLVEHKQSEVKRKKYQKSLNSKREIGIDQ